MSEILAKVTETLDKPFVAIVENADWNERRYMCEHMNSAFDKGVAAIAAAIIILDSIQGYQSGWFTILLFFIAMFCIKLGMVACELYPQFDPHPKPADKESEDDDDPDQD